jgi:hypothetical protein
MTKNKRVKLRINDGRNWHFVNGRWDDREHNILRVPDELQRSDGSGIQGHHYAFHKKLCYQDVCVRFEFRLMRSTDTGIILRATDESHFYLLHFPNCGQASRAQHFWVAFSKMDNSGYLKLIKMEMMRRVPSNNGLWLLAELTLKGSKISVKIDRHGYFEAEDNTYPGPGCIGVYSYGNSDIRNISVKGEDIAESPWDEKLKQPINWFHPCPDTEYGPWQRPSDLIRLPDGELLLSYIVQKEQRVDVKSTPLLSRSCNNGQTWSKPEILQISNGKTGWESPRLHLTPGERLISFITAENGFMVAESKDKACTWAEPVPVNISPIPPKIKRLNIGPQAFLNLSDGSIVLFCSGGYSLNDPDLTILTWGSSHCQAFACRSTDDGRTWSAPVNIDNPGCDAKGKQYEGNLDLTEVCGVQMNDGRIMALIRPIYSPWMWETWSEDGGRTWGHCVRGPFPGYATPNMLRTSSGAILVAHRLPSMTVHCSLDDGYTWKGSLIDSAIWCMGSMLEVEPDIVLYVYWDSFESLMRAQLIHVTSSGLKPIRKKWKTI